MPACIALSATGVRAAPSNGSSTIASTLSLMKVSTWLICVLTSLVPSATFRSTSLYFSASDFAAFVMPAIQPWSAAGAEKPMVTVSPDLSLLLVALLPPLLPELAGVFPVQPARRAPAPTSATAVVVRRRYPRCLVADMFSPRSAPGSDARCSGGAAAEPGGPPGGADHRGSGLGCQAVPPGRAPAGAPST